MVNVYSKSFNKVVPDDARWDLCDHLKVGDVATVVHNEDDSFGEVCRMAECKECYDVTKAAEAIELHTCFDCGEDKPGSEMNKWRWYDFYAPQGDEPLDLCDTCLTMPKHRQRVQKDNESAAYEYDQDF